MLALTRNYTNSRQTHHKVDPVGKDHDIQMDLEVPKDETYDLFSYFV